VNLIGAAAIILIVIVLLFRRAEPRLVLLTASVLLFLLARKLPEMLVSLASELANPKTVIPICASMGFAYVLRLTECDKHLVRLLMGPLDRPVARALLIPGAIATGYIVNMAIVSQSGTAAIVGSIAIPLLLSKGISKTTAGSLLLLGCSMGGELFNPGAVETVTLSRLCGIPSPILAQRSIPLNLLGCSTALMLFWWMAGRYERSLASVRREGETEDSRVAADPDVARSDESLDLASAPASADKSTFRPNLVKALVPFIPLVLLFAGTRVPMLRPFHDHVTILVAMLIGSIAAALVAPTKIGNLARAFFEGTGFAYTHIISVTVCATIFAQGIIANGLIRRVVGALAGRPRPALLASLIIPCALAALSGSGAGAATSMMTALIPGASKLHLDAAQMGILAAMGSHFGRTMSPAAAVAILCATLVLPNEASVAEIGSMTLNLTKRVALPLVAGGVVMYLAALVGLARVSP
jgi:DcuC family C4-dicarboxylate transporter